MATGTATRALIVPPIYSRLLARFPQNFSFCFAYGSGVKKQDNEGSGAVQSMIDLVYCVDNPKKWHEANLRENPTHYSGFKRLGVNAIARLQQNAGAKVYFNTLVPLEGVLIKYGVISTRDLITDLLDWSDLYLSGRLHKPVEIIKKVSNNELQTALQLNLRSAVHAALLTLPESFTEFQFYYTICNLSYNGDFRMIFGENKSKVGNIVKPQLTAFRNLYRPHLIGLTDYVDFPMLTDSTKVDQHCAQDVGPLARLHHLNQLPRLPQKALTKVWNRGNYKQDTEDVLRALAYDPDCSRIVAECIDDIVWKSSIAQSLKGILTGGLYKSLMYSGRKITKMFE